MLLALLGSVYSIRLKIQQTPGISWVSSFFMILDYVIVLKFKSHWKNAPGASCVNSFKFAPCPSVAPPFIIKDWKHIKSNCNQGALSIFFSCFQIPSSCFECFENLLGFPIPPLILLKIPPTCSPHQHSLFRHQLDTTYKYLKAGRISGCSSVFV